MELQILLQQVTDCLKRELQRKEEQGKRGEHFNVFSILKLSTNETRTHSALLAELLKTNGSHGMGMTFLQLFIEQIGYKWDEQQEHYKNARICVERYVGEINQEKTTGGRIDIIIESSDAKRAFVIENKINADDQPKQLKRYANYAESYYGRDANGEKRFHLLYLNLDNHKPDIKSSVDLEEGIDYHIISYREHILPWLTKCVEKSYNHPLVRETINQYIQLVKHLTHTNMSNQAKKDIVERMSDNIDNVLASKAIHDQFPNLMDEIINKRVIPAMKELAEELQLHFEKSEGSKWEGESWRQFSFEDKNKWQSHRIKFEFVQKKCNFADFCSGWFGEDYVTSELLSKQALEMGLEKSGNPRWNAQKRYDLNGMGDWKRESVLRKIYNEEFKNFIRQELAEWIKFADGILEINDSCKKLLRN